jgi:hypothetical protein
VETPYGAFAVIMNARYGLGSEDSFETAPSQRLDLSFFSALFTEEIRELGPANHYSKEDHIWHINENGMRWVYYQTNLFGDPAVAVKPTPDTSVSLEITYPQDEGAVYLFGKKVLSIPILDIPVIIGRISIQTRTMSTPPDLIGYVEFSLDDIRIYIDDTAPYSWPIQKLNFGRHTITATAYGLNGQWKTDTLEIFLIIL